jgi:hypothetical protein
MKKYIFLLLAAFVAISCNQSNKESKKSLNLSENENLKLQVYYFHLTNRCATCNSIENNVKELLENEYKNELEEGIIAFESLNLDDKENKDLAERFEAFGASLHLVSIKDGEEKDHDLTNYAFSYSRTQPEEFKDGLKETIDELIN